MWFVATLPWAPCGHDFGRLACVDCIFLGPLAFDERRQPKHPSVAHGSHGLDGWQRETTGRVVTRATTAVRTTRNETSGCVRTVARAGSAPETGNRRFHVRTRHSSRLRLRYGVRFALSNQRVLGFARACSYEGCRLATIRFAWSPILVGLRREICPAARWEARTRRWVMSARDAEKFLLAAQARLDFCRSAARIEIDGAVWRVGFARNAPYRESDVVRT